MKSSYKIWQKLFLFCLGLFLGTTFCMKWIEAGFWENGKLFTIIGLEISYPKERIISILSGLDSHVKTILRYHLAFDFVFMAGAYTGIAALCMMAREKKAGTAMAKVFIVLALLQLVAWACDIYENICLLKWIENPSSVEDITVYHIVVIAKWTIALAGALLAIPIAIRKSKNPV